MVRIRKFIRGIIGGCFIGNIFHFNGNIRKRKRNQYYLNNRNHRGIKIKLRKIAMNPHHPTATNVEESTVKTNVEMGQPSSREEVAMSLMMPPALLFNKIKECGGMEIVWVMEKKLYKTDLGRYQGRLPFPKKRVNVEVFLRKEERELMERKENPGILKVRILDPRGEWWDLDLRRWILGSGYVYVLTTRWYELATKNGFREDDITQVWSFRIPGIEDGNSNSRLCFAIDVVRSRT